MYNIPVLPSSPTSASKPVDGAPAPASAAAPSDKPEMTANPTQCPSAALRVAGECPHCTKVFCGSHRTPEAHHWYVLLGSDPPQSRAIIMLKPHAKATHGGCTASRPCRPPILNRPSLDRGNPGVSDAGIELTSQYRYPGLPRRSFPSQQRTPREGEDGGEQDCAGITPLRAVSAPRAGG